MGKLVLVCIGGALGSGARYVVATWAAEALGADFPRGTLLVNLAGSFFIAVVVDLSLRTAAIPPNLRMFLATGIMGGFTTYSSFNYETLHLLENGAFAYALLYLAATVVGCLLAGVLGLATARLLARVAAGSAVP
jgi:CrcB protein